MSDAQTGETGTPSGAKVYLSARAALHDVEDGAVILVAGFAGWGLPESLLRELQTKGVGGLTIIGQGSWPRHPESFGLAQLVAGGQVNTLVSPDPFYSGSGGPVEDHWRSGRLDIQVVPQGVLAERLRAGGAGLGGIFLPDGVGTRYQEGREGQEGKEARSFGGREYLFEPALRADFAFLRAAAADTLGNLVYRGTQRNWNPVMAMAGEVTVAEVDQVCEPGGLDPELVITPGIFVDRIVQTV
jgi:3-oxoacid CoA-transferase A subunit